MSRRAAVLLFSLAFLAMATALVWMFHEIPFSRIAAGEYQRSRNPNGQASVFEFDAANKATKECYL